MNRGASICAGTTTSSSGRRRNKNASSIGPPGNRPTSASLEDEFPQAGLLVQPAIEMKRVEARELNLVDHGSFGAEEMAPDRGVVSSAQCDMEMELRVRPHCDAPVEGQQFVALRERGLLVALRSEVPDLEVLEHPDPPDDRAALDAVLLRRGLEARDEVFPVREFHDDAVPFLFRLHRLTAWSASARIFIRRSTAFARSFAPLNAVYTLRGRHASMNVMTSSKSPWSLSGNCASRPYRPV